MPAEALTIPIAQPTLIGFIYTLSRVGSAFSLVPMPGFRAGSAAPRVVLILAITLALAPRWPTGARELSFWWLAGEVAFGATVGATMAWLVEAFTMGMQLLGLQAGYSYASTIDPSTQADSAVLQLMAQLGAGLLLFEVGLDREIVRVFAASLDRFPPGEWKLTEAIASNWIRWTASMITLSLRLALPVVAWLLMLDLVLALFGRLQAQLQLLSLAFPAKMLSALLLMAGSISWFPELFSQAAGSTVTQLWTLVGGR